MGFKQGAIGFYLQLENQLTPELGLAGNSYDKFVARMDRANKKAFTQAKKGMGALAGLAESFTSLPTSLAKSYEQTMAKLSKRSKPLKVPVEFVVKGGAKGGLSGAFSKALADAFRNTKVRLTAGMPKKRNPLFDNDQGLRTQFKSLVQPPDMTGSLIPKFNKGGLVTAGSGRKGVDDVLALLGKGEIVLPADVSKKLIEAAGAARGLGNQFIAFPAEIAESVSAIDALTKAGKKLKASFDAGLDPKAPEKLKVILDQLALEQAKLAKGATLVSQNYKTKLAPSIVEVTNDMKSFREEIAPTQNKMMNFIKKIAGNTGFLAVHTAMQTLQNDFLEVRSAMSEVAEGSGLNSAAEGLVTNFLEMNKVLHLNSSALNDFREQFIGLNKELPISLRDTAELSKTLNDLVQAGAGRELAVELYRGLSMFEKATGVAAESAQDLALVLTKQLNLGGSQTIDMLAGLAKQSGAVGVSAAMMTDNLQAAAEAGKLAFSEMGPAQAQTALTAITKIATAVQSVNGPGKEFAETIAGSLQDPQKLFALASALGTTQDELRGILATGNVQGFFKKMETAGPMASKAMAEAFGVSEDAIVSMTAQTGKMNDALDKMGAVSTKAGEGLQDLSAMAKDNMTTFQAIKGAVGGFLTQFAIVTDTMQFLKDLNPTAVLSGLFLFTKLWPAALSSVGTTLLSWGARIIPALLTGLAGTVIAVLGAAIGGFFAGWKISEWMEPVWDAVGQGAVKFFDWQLELVTTAWSKITGVVTGAWDGMIGYLSSINWSGIFKGAAVAIGQFLVAPLNSVLTAVGMDPITFGGEAATATPPITPASITTAAQPLPTKSLIDTMSSQAAYRQENRDDDIVQVLKAQLDLMRKDQGSGAGPVSTGPRRASGFTYDLAQGG